MTRQDDTDVTDPGLKGTANLLRGLPREAAPPALSDAVLAKVRPVAQRRRKVLRVVAVAALLAAAAWALMLLRALSEGAP